MGENFRKGVLFVRFYAPVDSRLKTGLKSQEEKSEDFEKNLPPRSLRTQREIRVEKTHHEVSRISTKRTTDFRRLGQITE